MADERRTVLLARPGEACDRLRAALAQAGVDVVLEADPLDTDVAQIRATEARNLVIAVDAETEDALERFDEILADDRFRILFEEVALVGARDGWDAARWARHLGAKLLGHGDVLPEGHELDDAPSQDETVLVASADDDVVEADDETFGFQLEDTGDEAPDEVLLVADATEADVSEPAADAGQDWLRFQDFEAVNELPAANAPQAAETDFRAALAPLDSADLPEEQAYERLEEEIAHFDASAPSDRWQDFERPVVEEEAPAPAAPQDASPPEAPSWSLTDEPLPVANTQAAATDGLAGLEDRIAALSLVDADDLDASAQAGQDQPETVVSGQPAAEGGPVSEGALLLLGGIGGPDPLRQILQQLATGFGVPVLVQQWLDGGQYDRLVRQMDRASQMPVALAEAGKPLQAGHVYIVPTALGLQRDADGAMHFIDAATRGFADVLSALPAGASGVVLLSGASEDFVEPVQRFQQAGGRVFAQSAEGCYDHAVPALLIQRGAEAHSPAGLATQLAARWQQQVSA